MRDIATQVFATHRQVLSGVHLGRSRFRVDEDARGKSGGGRHGDQCQNGCQKIAAPASRRAVSVVTGERQAMLAEKIFHEGHSAKENMNGL